jgi:UDP-glucose 4-epimerase
MLDAIDRDEPLTLYGDGSQAYDFVYAGDCGEANVCAMRADTVDRAYNVGTGVRTSIRELAEILLRITGSDVGIRYLPEGLTFVRNRIGSPTRARDEIGFEARVSLEDGLRALIDWRQSHQQELRQRRERSLAP